MSEDRLLLEVGLAAQQGAGTGGPQAALTLDPRGRLMASCAPLGTQPPNKGENNVQMHVLRVK